MIMANKWMGDLCAKYPEFEHININRLLVPGSHDSGTSQMSSFARTQSLTIREQLEQGIRYLDIRPRVHDSTYYVHHGETGPDGSADLGHYSTNLNPDDTANDKYIFKQIRDFLKSHPKEILILKFQNYKKFTRKDYLKFIKLIRAYFTFDIVGSKCQLARFDHGTGVYIARETVGSLLESDKRVFIIWSTEDVPTGSGSSEIGDYTFQFTPSLTPKTPYCLWDPYWHEADRSLPDDWKCWWGWHEKNLRTWAAGPASGFFVLQSQMKQLPNFYPEASAERNNPQNIKHYIDWARAGKPMNIMTFDFVNHGDLVRQIVGYYCEKFD
jgi:hypothetical protein